MVKPIFHRSLGVLVWVDVPSRCRGLIDLNIKRERKMNIVYFLLMVYVVIFYVYGESKFFYHSSH